eukprot:scaffold3345_cov117-Isochrysis_galbana.AAC.1
MQHTTYRNTAHGMCRAAAVFNRGHSRLGHSTPPERHGMTQRARGLAPAQLYYYFYPVREGRLGRAARPPWHSGARLGLGAPALSSTPPLHGPACAHHAC